MDSNRTTVLENAVEEKQEKVTAENRYEDIIEFDTPAYKPRKKRLGDRRDGRRLRTLPAMYYI